MIDVSELTYDPDLAQPFTILRSSGKFVAGVWQAAVNQIDGYGIIEVATAKQLMQVPEADRVTGSMVFYSQQKLYVTHAGGQTEGTSDVLQWRGQNFRIASVEPWIDFGVYVAIAVRMSGE